MTGAYEETLTDMRSHVAGAEPGAARTADNLRQEEAKEPAREPSEGAHPNDSDLGSLVHAHMWPSHTQERPAAVGGAWLPAPSATLTHALQSPNSRLSRQLRGTSPHWRDTFTAVECRHELGGAGVVALPLACPQGTRCNWRPRTDRLFSHYPDSRDCS